MLTRLLPILVAAFACWVLGWLPMEAAVGVLPMFLLPSCGCCTPATPVCGSACTTIPASATFVVSGLANSNCLTCSGMDGTYIFSSSDFSSISITCFALITFSPSCGSGSAASSYQAFMFPSGGNIRAGFKLHITASATDWTEITFVKDFGASPGDCAALGSGVNIPFQADTKSGASPFRCTGASATCTATYT